jgi:hypothetical protein
MSRDCYAKFTESGLPFPRTLHRSRLDTELCLAITARNVPCVLDIGFGQTRKSQI